MVRLSDLKVKVGSPMPFPSVTTTAGRVVTFKRTTGPRYVHLCIGRFSGCPMCNLNYRAYSRKLAEVEKADCEFVVVLHTNKELIQENQGSAEWSKDMNWVADPGFETYKKLGVGRQPLWRALFSWTVLVTAVRGMFHRMFFGRTPLDFFRRSLSDPVRTQVPLDLFIDTRSGLITALGYGPSLSDHKTADWAIEQAKRQ